MKDCIIISPYTSIYKSYMFNDISKNVFINSKNKYKYDNQLCGKIDFPLYSNKDPKHYVQCIWLSTIKKTIDKTYKLKTDYNIDDYHKYIGTQIINVDNIKEIPDYDVLMGVPISILIYPTNQFEILGLVPNTSVIEDGFVKTKFTRILIKKKNINEQICTRPKRSEKV